MSCDPSPVTREQNGQHGAQVAVANPSEMAQPARAARCCPGHRSSRTPGPLSREGVAFLLPAAQCFERAMTTSQTPPCALAAPVAAPVSVSIVCLQDSTDRAQEMANEAQQYIAQQFSQHSLLHQCAGGFTNAEVLEDVRWRWQLSTPRTMAFVGSDGKLLGAVLCRRYCPESVENMQRCVARFRLAPRRDAPVVRWPFPTAGRLPELHWLLAECNGCATAAAAPPCERGADDVRRAARVLRQCVEHDARHPDAEHWAEEMCTGAARSEIMVFAMQQVLIRAWLAGVKVVVGQSNNYLLQRCQSLGAVVLGAVPYGQSEALASRWDGESAEAYADRRARIATAVKGGPPSQFLVVWELSGLAKAQNWAMAATGRRKDGTRVVPSRL